MRHVCYIIRNSKAIEGQAPSSVELIYYKLTSLVDGLPTGWTAV